MHGLPVARAKGIRPLLETLGILDLPGLPETGTDPGSLPGDPGQTTGIKKEKKMGAISENTKGFKGLVFNRTYRISDSCKAPFPLKSGDRVIVVGYNTMDDDLDIQVLSPLYGVKWLNHKCLEDTIQPVNIQEKPDMIKHPDHYTFRGTEAIEAVKILTATSTGVEAYLLGCIVKYLYRYPRKNGDQDLAKAEQCIHMLREYLEKRETK